MLEIVFSLLMFLGITVALVNEYYAHKLKLSPMPTLPWVTQTILKDLATRLPKDKALTIYELGSGWGGLAQGIAKTFPKAQVKGYEISPFPFLYSWLFRRRKNCRFYRKDVLTLSMDDADALVFYLTPYLLQKLKPMFEKQLKPGTWVIANGFEIEGWSPIEEIELAKALEKKIYIYQM